MMQSWLGRNAIVILPDLKMKIMSWPDGFAIILIILPLALFTGCCSISCPWPFDHPDQTAFPAPASSPRILATVPDIRQGTPYSCGAASLQAILSYWGRDIREDELRAMLNTSEESGTLPANIVNVSRSLGFSAEARTSTGLPELEAAVRAGIPVIVGLQVRQGNFTPPIRVDDFGYGHYMIVIGMDADNVYLEDPMILGSRASIPRDRFLSRWHDASFRDVWDPGAIRFRRLAIFIRGERPA